MSRIVLDTNVVFAGLRSKRGASFQVLGRLGTNAFEACVSVPLVLEYESVLRLRAEELGLTETGVDGVLNYFVSVAHHQEVFYLWRPRLRDPKDDMILELAVAAGARKIITYNVRDLADAARFGIAIVTPGQFLTVLGSTE